MVACDGHDPLHVGLQPAGEPLVELETEKIDLEVSADRAGVLGALGVLNDVRLGNNRRQDMCRAALVEIEFISNPDADKLLVSGADAKGHRAFKDVLAKGYGGGITRKVWNSAASLNLGLPSASLSSVKRGITPPPYPTTPTVPPFQ